jgi:hypothetical protein
MMQGLANFKFKKFRRKILLTTSGQKMGDCVSVKRSNLSTSYHKTDNCNMWRHMTSSISVGSPRITRQIHSYVPNGSKHLSWTPTVV